MSLPPPSSYSVPEQTRRVARAAFPKSTLCLRLADELGTIFQDQDFADLFPSHGQPAEAPFRLALVTVLQFLEGLSDRAAAEAVRSRSTGNTCCVWNWMMPVSIILSCVSFAHACWPAVQSIACLTVFCLSCRNANGSKPVDASALTRRT